MYSVQRKEQRMKKVARIVGLCSKPLQRRYLAAAEPERAELLRIVEQESDWIVNKLSRKGYVLEGRVAGIYGIFTRGHARGTITVDREMAGAS
jgi:hypothetical protein